LGLRAKKLPLNTVLTWNRTKNKTRSKRFWDFHSFGVDYSTDSRCFKGAYRIRHVLGSPRSPFF